MKVIFLSISYSENDHISFYEELLQEFVANGHEVSLHVLVKKEKKEIQEFQMKEESMY